MSSVLLMLVLAQYTPQEAQTLFVEANDAYYQSDFAGAQTRYEKLLRAGQGGPDVLFNLGTTHLAAGELGQAVLYLERAKRLSADEDIEANLSVAQERQVDQVLGEEASVPFTQRLAEVVEERSVGLTLLICSWLGFAMAWVTRQRHPGSRLFLGLISGVIIAVAVGASAALLVRSDVKATVREAIVIPEAVPVREAPKDAAKVAFEIHAGLKVRLLETTGPYARIRLPNALEGWAEAAALTSIEP